MFAFHLSAIRASAVSAGQGSSRFASCAWAIERYNRARTPGYAPWT